MAMTPEGRVKKKVREFLTANDIWYFMSVQQGFGVQGIPDFLCCWCGVFLAIETKAPGKHNNLSAWQKLRRQEILKAGGAYLVVSDIKQLEDWLNGYEKIEKPGKQARLQKRVRAGSGQPSA